MRFEYQEGMSCPSWQRHRTGCHRSLVWTLPLPPVLGGVCMLVAPLWCDLRCCCRTVVVLKLRRTSAFLPQSIKTIDFPLSFASHSASKHSYLLSLALLESILQYTIRFSHLAGKDLQCDDLGKCDYIGTNFPLVKMLGMVLRVIIQVNVTKCEVTKSDSILYSQVFQILHLYLWGQYL